MNRSSIVMAALWIVGAMLLAACIQPIQPAPLDGSTTDEAAAGGAGAEEVTMYVGPELVDCVGVAPMKCMLVKTDPDAEYEFFYSQIDGFEFEPGYEYELRVLVEPVEDAPADASTLNYTLIEVVNQTPVAGEVEEIIWEVTSYVNAAGDMVDAIPGAEPTIRQEDEQVGGTTGCNNYFGAYTLDGDQVTIGQLNSTMMACPEPLMQQERDFLAALSQVTSFVATGDSLTLLDANGAPVMDLVRQEHLPLVGTDWTVTGYNNGTGGFTSVLADTELTARFDESSVGGSAGCNNYSASYETDGHTISVGLAVTTMKMCPEEIMTQESAFLAALASAATYDIQAGILTMYQVDGARAVSFAAETATDDATSEAEPAELGDLTVPSEFGEDGQIELKDGVFIGPPVAPGSATRVTATLTDFNAEGELDGIESTAGVLVVDPGGSGTFYELVVVQGELANPDAILSTTLGDRIQINSLAIEDNEIVIDMVTQGPDDPFCCPTQNVIRTYAVENNELVQRSEEVVGGESIEAPQATTPAEGDQALAGVTWEAESLVNADGEVIDVLHDAAPTVAFADGEVSGSDGCNRFTGSAIVGDETLEFGPLASTAMMCVGPVDEQAQAFQSMLMQVAGYQVNGEKLELLDADGAVLATFVPQETPELVGTAWSATGVNNGRGGVASLVADTEIIALFGDDGTLSGNDGCNDFNASYTLDGDAIEINLGPSTLMACPDEIMTQASAFQAALSNAATYSIDGDQLELRDADGALQVSFVPQETPALTGTNWEAAGVNNGRGGVASLVADTEITALFAEDGTVSGSAGCNSYNAAYTVDGAAIEIGEAATTRMLCPDPVMEQESAYLAALSNATTYSIDGDRLQLRDDDGALQVDFRAEVEMAAGDAGMATALPATSDAVMLTPGDLATSYHWRVAPALAAGDSPAAGATGLPDHVVITFDSQPPDVAASEDGPMVHVIPVAEYLALREAAGSADVAEQIAALQALLDERPATPATPLRHLPNSLAANSPGAPTAYVDGNGFSGLRYVEQTADGLTVYAFQGLNDDGRFLIAVRWPVTASGDSWRPDLAQIDALIQSLEVVTGQ